MRASLFSVGVSSALATLPIILSATTMNAQVTTMNAAVIKEYFSNDAAGLRFVIGDLTVYSMGPLSAYKNLTGLSADQKAFYPGFTIEHGSAPELSVKQKAVFDELTEDKGSTTSP